MGKKAPKIQDTGILCPECMRKNLYTTGEMIDKQPKLKCDVCQTFFAQTGNRTVRYR